MYRWARLQFSFSPVIPWRSVNAAMASCDDDVESMTANVFLSLLFCWREGGEATGLGCRAESRC